MTNKLISLLNKNKILAADGAMGTNLFEKGLQSGDAPEIWNETKSSVIENLHKSFIEAGSNIILTNTFGSNSFRLKLHNKENMAHKYSSLGAKIAKNVASKYDDVLVAGSIGPSGELLQPIGNLSKQDMKEGFSEQAQGLKDGGADILWVETMSDLDEAKIAIAASLETGLPVICTMTFDTAAKTMMGVSPKQSIINLKDVSANQSQICAIGANCGVGPSDAVYSVKEIIENNDDNLPVIIKANCGIPKFENGEFVFSGTPELMKQYGKTASAIGASIIGGCCGSTPNIVRSIKSGIEEYLENPYSISSVDEIISELGPLQNAPSDATSKNRKNRRQK